MTKFYALYSYHYDYYEFQEVICASDCKLKLIDYASTILPSKFRIIDMDNPEDKDWHDNKNTNDLSHYAIEEVTLL